jgi:hypothetical protein
MISRTRKKQRLNMLSIFFVNFYLKVKKKKTEGRDLYMKIVCAWMCMTTTDKQKKKKGKEQNGFSSIMTKEKNTICINIQ